MDVREKLFTLFQDCNNPSWKWFPNNAEMLKLIDYLIANGVTAQDWISVNDRLPEEEGLYLVAVVNDHERRYSKTAWYHGHGNWFLHQKVTHWRYLPQPPKGE